MKIKSLIVLLLAGIWGIGSWYWYTCKVKGFCGADNMAAHSVANTDTPAKHDDAMAEAQAKADADKAAAEEQAKADADKTAAEEQAKADADKAAAEEQAKADADKATAEEQAKADADKAAAEEQAKADADKAAAEEQAKADADKAAAEEQAKADADKAAAEEQAKADADKITMETNQSTTDSGSGIDPARLYFPSGGANPQLADDTKAYFEKLATFLKDNSSGTVSIVGYTDSQGDAARNKALGLKRAESIKQMLVDMGVPADQVKASSEGEESPIADNNTAEGRKKNRRVEITPAK